MSDILILPSGGGSGSDDCTATRAQLLSGYTGILSDTDDEPGTGTMVNRGAVSQSLPINGSYTIPQGYHNGSGKVTQSIPTQGGSTTTPGTAAKTIVAANRYVTGNIVVAGDRNLVPGNIKKNVTIFGVRGTWSGYVPSATDLYLRGNNPAGFRFLPSTDSVTFESGAIYYNAAPSTAGITSTNSYNLSKYTRINAEIMVSGSSGRLRFLLGSSSTSNADAYATIESFTPGQTFTLSMDISGVNKTDTLYLCFQRTSGNLTAQIYHIWLS